MKCIKAEVSHFQWIINRIGCQLTTEARGLMAIDDEEKIHGMIVFDSWTPNSCQAHIALSSPIALRCLLNELFDYAFNQADRSIILCIIRSHNVDSSRLVRHMGFVEVARIVAAYSSVEDLLIFQLRKEKCRFIEEPDCAPDIQPSRSATRGTTPS